MVEYSCPTESSREETEVDNNSEPDEETAYTTVPNNMQYNSEKPIEEFGKKFEGEGLSMLDRIREAKMKNDMTQKPDQESEEESVKSPESEVKSKDIQP